MGKRRGQTALTLKTGWISPIQNYLNQTNIKKHTASIASERLARLQRDWQTLAATLGQLRKGRAWLEKHLN